MAINIRITANGWIVEVWRARTLPREEHVFLDFEAMLVFVRETAKGARL